jgi:hypothetical protein
MSKHPYEELPSTSFWRKSVAGVPIEDVDPVASFSLRINEQAKVATAGSCFAQHVARHLRDAGYNHFIAEAGHPILPEEVRRRNNYGLFSCRYGNIYTARQLRQLVDRAYGRFVPTEDAWVDEPDLVRDPFRPTVQPGGFVSFDEMRRDRAQHFAAVRRMFEQLDVFVFTLGLTECWRSRDDGAVFPLCPGVEGGDFDPSRHEFYNQGVDEVIEDLAAVVNSLAAINPSAEVVLTVSPVPLIATAERGAHVLAATTYSKSVLRVAAEAVVRRFSNVHYFPAYEIVTGAFNRGTYFAPDLRNVMEEGVAHVMHLFMKHASGGLPSKPARSGADSAQLKYLETAQRLVEVECDETLLDKN